MNSPKYDFPIDLSEHNNSHSLMVELVGEGKRVLEVGCATGYMTRVLAERGCRVVGIEVDPHAAARAGEHCDEVVVADVEHLDLVERFGEASFDVVVFGDVLEHLREPLVTLRRARGLLVADGCVVASVPNVAHGAVRLALLQGRFEYRPLGLLDESHIRFFTRASMERLFRDAGFAIVDMRRTVRGVFDTEIPLRRRDFPRRVRRLVEVDREATTYQFVVRAVPLWGPEHRTPGDPAGETSPAPRVTVVIPNWNGARHLVECLNALAAQSYHDFDTLVVDNGSTDGSLDLLRERYPWVRILPLGENRGFPAAANAGIRASRSEYVVLLNNDTRADPDWLGNLVRAMDETPQAGFGASKMLRYDQPDLIDAAGDGFSLRSWAGTSLGAGEPASRYAQRAWVFGACAGAAIYRRSLFDDIGLFDDDFFLSHEDVDLDLRAQIAGHRCLFVPEAVVYHKRWGSTDVSAADVLSRALRNRIWVVGKGLPIPLLAVWAGVFLPRLLGQAAIAGLRRRIGPRLRRPGHSTVLHAGVPAGRLRDSDYLRQVLVAFRHLPRKRREVRALRRVGTVGLLAVLLRPYRPITPKGVRA